MKTLYIERPISYLNIHWRFVETDDQGYVTDEVSGSFDQEKQTGDYAFFRTEAGEERNLEDEADEIFEVDNIASLRNHSKIR